MEPYEGMKDVLRQKTAKEIAAELGVSLSLVYKWAETDAAGGTNSPLERVGQLIELTQNPKIMQWLCAKADGFFIRNPSKVRHDGPLIPLTNDIVQEFADMLATIAHAASDNLISAEEAKRIRARWEELKSVTEGFVQAAELGNFAKLRPVEPPAGGAGS